MKYIVALIFYSFICQVNGQSTINPEAIDIVRDRYGVPHIFAPTDAGVAYGLAWAHAEDDFKTIQQAYLAGNELLTKAIGNKGLTAEFITQFIGSKELVEKDYDDKISPEYKKVIEGYAQGLVCVARKEIGSSSGQREKKPPRIGRLHKSSTIPLSPSTESPCRPSTGSSIMLIQRTAFTAGITKNGEISRTRTIP